MFRSCFIAVALVFGVFTQRTHAAPPIPDSTLGNLPFSISVPDGFRIDLVASGVPLQGARFVAVAPNGDIVVSVLSRGNVLAYRPGVAGTTPIVVATGLEKPNGLAFFGNDLYIGTWTGVAVVRDYPRGAGKPQALVTDMPRNPGHNARAVAVAADGAIFVSAGSSCNVCTERDTRLATILRYAADGSGGVVYARGLRNASGLAFDSDGRLWAVVNQRDNLAPDHTNLPPDELVFVRQDGDYGWPSSYPDLAGRRRANPEYPGAQTDRFLPSDFVFQAHSAPLGVAFDTAGVMPGRYRGALFVAFHGSWNRNPPTGYKVVAVLFKDGRPAAVEDFASGWLSGRTVLGRPVGVAVAQDGSLYVTDDTGYLFRITRTPE